MSDRPFDIYGGDYSDEFIRSWTRKRYCPRCGNQMRYDSVEKYVCMGCGTTELDDYAKIREYLRLHGPTPAKVVEAETGIPSAVIMELLNNGVIELPKHSEKYLFCEKCGATIRHGRWCARCASSQLSGLGRPASKWELPEDPEEEAAEEEKKPARKKRDVPQMHTWVNGKRW